MEKRTIVAFVLSFLVLLLWSTLFGPKEAQKPPVTVAPENKPAPAASPSTGATASRPVPVGQEDKTVSPSPVEERMREITVETPLYKVTFSNAGAAIKSIKLKKYRLEATPDSPLVELSHTQ
ncbi:MAG: membrane protein insertase YidC, partial [Pseudomonadota bacterium]